MVLNRPPVTSGFTPLSLRRTGLPRGEGGGRRGVEAKTKGSRQDLGRNSVKKCVSVERE